MSALRLWHPAGRHAAMPEPGQSPCDVAVVAPSARQGRARLHAAVAEAAVRLAPEGIGWIIAGRAQRAAAERAVAQAGLVVVDRVLMVPAWPATEHLVSLAPAALRDAGVRHLGLAPRSARALGQLCRTPTTQTLLARGARCCALVVARPGATQPLRWLGALDGAGVVAATVSAGPRRDARVAVALRFGRGPQADLAVKVALDGRGAQRLRAERAALGGLGGAAARAGAAVPVLHPTPDDALLVTGVLPGQPAVALLGRSPERLDHVLRALGDWLLAWNRATVSPVRAPAALLERRLLSPAARVGTARPSTGSYVEAMRRLAARLQGAPLLGATVHDDLTMSNVLLGRDRLGIVDWEVATADGLPLLDLWYALADGVARARRIAHVRAVELLTSAAGMPTGTPADLPAQHAAALGLSPDQALLGFHACWLGHADDELRRGRPGPFVAVVESLAAKETQRA